MSRVPMNLSVTEAAPPAAEPVMRRPSLAGRTRAGLDAALAEIGIPEKERRMRVGQLWNWIYHFGVRDFAEMTTIGKGLRAQLAEYFTLDLPEVTAEQVSSDGTRKWLLRMAPTGPRDRLGDFPNRSAPDGAFVPNDGGRFVSNIVFMGMGEPLYNFDGVRDAIGVITDDQGLSIGRRRITVSTSGVVPQIGPLGDEMGTMLAISLHAVRDELRNELVPLNKKYPIKDLLDACRNYPGLSNAKRITFEYVMLKGVNDSDAEARELVRLLKGIPAKINLIPFNPWPGTRYECSDWERIERFSEIVFKAGYASPVRTPRGRDILAACGQLKSETEKLSARARLMLEQGDADAVAAPH
ncbi:MAG: 23S rRNA (adenine(2503)-C(2))-methyltransferase RlmN [Hyphomicrobiales bacterium]|nr:MAG: 23S rRNA (adenine(2503)-C(2))-methyltransferase RlmN [Hyphomicrobiales bacterium]